MSDIRDLPKKRDFLAIHGISEDDYRDSGLKWHMLKKIYNDHRSRVDYLRPIARFVADRVLQIENVHAVRYRVKEPEHLVAKVIRKCSEAKSPYIDSANYRVEVSDLLGVRALHLFKSQWIEIHKRLNALWDIAGHPVANHDGGDPPYLLHFYEDNDCELKEHKHGYRSIHYDVELLAGKEPSLVEIQVRTLFEEAWAEVDHALRYPKFADSDYLNQYMRNISLHAGLADEMSGIAEFLQKQKVLEQELRSSKVKKALRSVTDGLAERSDAILVVWLPRISVSIPSLATSHAIKHEI